MQNKWIRTALLGLGVIAAVASHAAGRITGVSVVKVGKGVEVLIHGSNLGKPKAGFQETATNYALEFDAQLAIKPTKLNIWQNGLESIQPVFAEGKTKLKFKFTEPINAIISNDPNGLKVSFEQVDLMAILLSEPELKQPTEAAQTLKVAPTSTSTAKVMPKVAPTIKAPVDFLLATKQPAVLKTTKAAQPFATLPAIVTAPKKVAYTPAPAASEPVIEPIKPMVPSSGTKASTESRVSLDFVDTQIVNIIKSLALQTRTNIVTSPDVTGKLSVKLEKVTVGEALNLVTSLAGLKYAQVGKTYVVTTEAKFAETVRLAQGAKNDAIMSRVVPVYSGQTVQVKMAVLKSVSSETPFGRYEIMLPSEKTVVSGGPAPSDKDSKGASTSTASNDDPYVMLIGSPGRLDEVENLIRNIDKQLCVALGIKPPKTQEFITKSYIVHGGRAADLIEALAGKGKTNVGNVECFATPSNSIAKQTIVLRGNSDEVEGVLSAFEALDSDQAATMTEFQVFDLKYTDPRSVREALIANIPGLSVVIAPNAVLNPKVYQEDRLRNQSEQRGTDTPAPQGGGTLAASGNQNGMQAMQGGQQGGQGGQQTQLQGDKTDANTGLVLPFDAFEAVGMPMRLIMKGSKDQVDRAVQLIGQMDTPPKQVSLELRVMEVSREELLRLGINWNLFTSGAVKTIRLNNPGATTGDRTVGVSVQGRDVSGDVAAMLDSISNGSRLISRPNMICNDGRSNEVFVGDVIRYIESIISGQNGPTITQGTVSTGVRLAAFPRLGGDGTINLDLRTKVVYLKGWEVVQQIGGRLPQTSERTAQNSITLRDGETFAIGGLIQQEDRKQMTGLPFLKDLPIFGQFFRSTTRDRVKTEIVIFVTAKMVKVGEDKSLSMEKDISVDKNGEYKPVAKKKGGSN